MTEASVRPPKQRRSQQSLERVIEASKGLLEEKGFEGFTIQDVSQRADVSVGAIYARFGNKESLLRAVHQAAMESLRPEHEAVAAVDAKPAKPAREVISDAVQTVAGIFRGNEKLLRALMHLGTVDTGISRRGSESSPFTVMLRTWTGSPWRIRISTSTYFPCGMTRPARTSVP